VFTATVKASPGTLSVPALYDNSEPSENYGQLFQATEPYISGMDFYIGDPTRPTNTTVNGLSGFAYLNLYDANAGGASAPFGSFPTLLESSEVQDENGYTFGLTEFDLSTPFAAVIGDNYILAIQTSDQYGLGLTSQTGSSYGPEYESNIKNGAIGKAGGNNRDTSFLVLNVAPVPEPISGNSAILVGAVVGCYTSSRTRRK
jgi:hypothetical protein